MDNGFRQLTLSVLDKVATAKVASISPKRLEEAKVITFARLLVDGEALVLSSEEGQDNQIALEPGAC